MPVYRIEIPGQGVFRVDSPVELDDTQAYQAVLDQMPGLGTQPAKPASFFEYLKTIPLEDATKRVLAPILPEGTPMEKTTKNPLAGAVGRAAELAGSGIEAVAEVAERAADKLELAVPLSNIPEEQIRNEKQLQPLFNWAKSLKGYNEKIGYQPSTKLGELADNPINAVPFIVERVITSTPDMAAAVINLPAYIGTRTKEILDERMKNDNKTLDDATVGDVTAAAGAAIVEGTLERFATGRLLKGAPAAKTRPGRIAKETGLQAGTEGIEEGAAYLGEAAGTIKGVDRQELLERMLEGAIVGGGLGAGVQTGKEVLGRKEPPKAEEPITEEPVVPPRREEEIKQEVLPPEEEGMAAEDLALEAFGEAPAKTFEEPAKTVQDIAETTQVAPPPEEIPAVTAEDVQKVLTTPPTEAPRAVEPEMEAAPEIPEETVPEKQLPSPRESDLIKEQMLDLENEARLIREIELQSKNNSLYNFFRDNKLEVKEVTDITPDKSFNFIRKKGGAFVSDFVGTGQMNPWLPPQLQIYGTEDADTLGEKESEATEYIKEKLRNGNFLTFETEQELEQINLSLNELENLLVKDLSYEQLIEEANSLAADIAATEGFGPPETAAEEGAAGRPTERVGKLGAPEEGVRFRQVTAPLVNEETGATISSPFLNAVANRGYKMLPLKSSRTYRDRGGQPFRTFEKDGVRVAFQTQAQIYADPQRPSRNATVYFGNDNDVVFQNLVVDKSKRRKGLAKKALQDIVDIADQNNFNVYLEPVQLEKAGATKKDLEKLYAQFGFVGTDPDNKVMKREPKVRPALELKAETAEETVARQEKDDAERESRELKKIADLERDLFKLEQESNPVTPPVQQSLFDVNLATPSPVLEPSAVTPSFTREFDRLSKALDKGVITPNEFAAGVQAARRAAIDAKEAKPLRDRVRGMDFIIERLRNGLRNGALTNETVELTEWFMKQNPALVQDLGISIRNSEKEGVGGEYMPTPRIVRLIVGSTKTDTAVHEILHHLERMLPEKIRNDIVKSWSTQFAAAKKAAIDTKDESLKEYFDLLTQHHATGDVKQFEQAINLIKNGNVDYTNYQFANPSEFWAVNASDIVQGRYDVRGDRLGALKRWLSDLVQKLKSVLGMKSNAPIIRALDSLAKSDGKFVSTEMLAGTGIYPAVRKNVFGATPPQPGWGRPDDSKVDDVIFTLQDKMIDTKRVIQEIEKTQGRLKDRWNAYLQEELYHGRTAKQTNDFLQEELSPLLKAIQAKGFTLADVEEYLHNRHAEERNIQVAKVNPNMPDGGSGIMTADARKYLAGLTTKQKADLDVLANRVDAITKKTREILVANGLEDPSTIAAWEKAYKNYVPLNRAEDDYELSGIGKGVGQGFSVRGPSSKRAVGSERQVVDILANIAMQRERAIVRSEKTRVAQAVYGLAVQHPNTSFWLAVDPEATKDPAAVGRDLVSMGINPADAANIMAEPTQTYVDPQTGLVTQRINPALRGAENVLAVRVNGKDKFVFFNTRDERAVRMAVALKNLDADQLSRAMSMVARVTRYFAAINTQYNPIFGAINFLRDYQGAALNLTNTPIAGETKKVMADTWPALLGIYADLRAKRQGKTATGQWAKLWDEFQEEGGQTGFRDQFSRSQERSDALERELKRITEGKPKQTVRALFDWLSDYNETMENAVRLAAYKAALDKGLTKEQAASVAKNLTVNFNRKGQVARQVNALYAFFNASVQGTARMYQTLRGPAGKKIFYGGLLLGSAQALLLAAAGFDEDEPKDFVKERNLIIPTGGDKYITIPMPLGFNVIPNTSRIMTEWFLSGGKDTSKRVAQITGAFLEMFNPIGNAGWSFQTFAPTIADPAVALFENRDWTGKAIAKKDISELDPTPGYTRAKETASWFSKKLAEFLNYATGGTKYRPGVFSPTPDQIDYLIGQLTGGVGREIMKAEQTITSQITGEELPSYKIPLVGRFYGETKSQAAQRDRFYDNVRLINEHENEIKGRRKNREPVDEYYKENPEARLFGYANAVERQINNLRRRREDMIKRGAPKDEVQAIEKKITEVMTKFNDRIKQAKEAKQ